MSVANWTYLFVGLSFSLYLFIAYVSRVKDTKGFYVAGGGVPAAANGMATAADWMSAASFISMAGLISFMGYAGGMYLMGWTGGYVLLALLLAPYLRKFGHFTVPDFIGDRYASNIARVVAVICTLFVSFTYVAGQMRGVGVVFSRFLDVPIDVGVVIGMAIVFVYATLGGMKGITWTQVAQYWVLISAFLVPVIAISFRLTGNPVPQIGLGSEMLDGGHLLDKLDQIHADLGFASYTDAFAGKWDKANVFFVALALMAGTAGLPHVIVRFYTVKNVRAARWSAFWALLFISFLYLSAPATAAFARYYMIDSSRGKRRPKHPNGSGIGKRPVSSCGWMTATDAFAIRTAKTTRSLVTTPARSNTRGPQKPWTRSTPNMPPGSKQQARRERDWRPRMRAVGLSGPDRDIIVLASPGMAELTAWIIALMAAGGLAAALSTASGLLLVISSAVAHDLYARMLRPESSEKQRLRVGRIVIGFAVGIAGLFGIFPPGFVSQVVAFAFGLAAASFSRRLFWESFQKKSGYRTGCDRHVDGPILHAFLHSCRGLWRYGALDIWRF